MEPISTPDVKQPAKADKAVATPTATTVPEPVKPVEVKTQSAKVSLADLAASTTESVSEPNRAAIDRHAAKTADQEKTNGTGSGQAGKKRGPYKKSGEKSTVGTPTKSKTGDKEVEAEKAALEKYEKDYKAGAEFIDGIVTYGAAMGGPTWYWRPPATRKIPHPQKQGEFITIEFDERTKGTDAFGKLFGHYGWGGEASPLVGVAFFCLQYAQIRLKDPEVREKALSLWDKMKLKLFSSKLKREKAEREMKERIEREAKDKEKGTSGSPN